MECIPFALAKDESPSLGGAPFVRQAQAPLARVAPGRWTEVLRCEALSRRVCFAHVPSRGVCAWHRRYPSSIAVLWS